MNAFRSNVYWDDDFLYYDDDPTSCLDELVDEFVRPLSGSGKIVELTDTGSDARSPGIDEKNNNVIGKSVKINNSRDSKIHETMRIERKVTPRSGGDTGRYGNKKNLYFTRNVDDNDDDDDYDEFMKNSLNSLAVSSITFNIADREANDDNDEEDFEDFDNSSVLRSKKRFIDRAVDSDCLSNSSRSSTIEKSHVSSRATNQGRKKLNARTQAISSSKASRAKKLTKSHENVDEYVFGNNSRAKLDRCSRTKKFSSAPKNLANKKNLTETNLPEVERKLDSISRTIIGDIGKPKSTRERSEIPRPVRRVSSKRKDSPVAKKISFEGSKLPVWQGRGKKPKIVTKFKDVRGKIGKDVNEIVTTNSRVANVAEDDSSDEDIMKVDKNRKINVESNSEERDKVSIKSSYSGDFVDSQRVKFKDEKLQEFVETKRTEDNKRDVEVTESTDAIEGIVEIQCKPEASESDVGAKTKIEDQSKSDLWSRNYEEAYAKGREVGLRVYRMAKAAREERKRAFRKYGFEDYNKKPREKPQEIVDIGVSLVEKLVDDRTENYYKRDSMNIRDMINRGYFISQLN